MTSHHYFNIETTGSCAQRRLALPLPYVTDINEPNEARA